MFLERLSNRHILRIIVVTAFLLPGNSVSAQEYKEISKLKPSTRRHLSHFGSSVAIAGNDLAIGSDAGEVAMFSLINGFWKEVQLLKPFRYSNFGKSVALQDTLAVIGAPNLHLTRPNGEVVKQNASTFIYRKVSDGTWVEFQKLSLIDGEELTGFGSSVAISEKTLVIGAPTTGPTKEGNNTLHGYGAAYVFESVETGEWELKQKLTPDQPIPVHMFGSAVAIDRNQMVIGAMGRNEAAYFFERSADGLWKQEKKVEGGGGFGFSVSLSKNIAAIGSPSDGSVSVFEKNESEEWIGTQRINKTHPENFPNLFGIATALFGHTLVIGASYDGDRSHVRFPEGAAYVYERDEHGTWNEIQQLSPADLTLDDMFGHSIAISKNKLIIGSAIDGDEEGVSSAGAAYLFSKRDESDQAFCSEDPYVVPNVMTPNNDDFNEFFVIENINETTSLVIYNRYGKPVYSNSNYNNSWDGSDLSSGTYYYRVRKNEGDCVEVYKGYLQILR